MSTLENDLRELDKIAKQARRRIGRRFEHDEAIQAGWIALEECRRRHRAERGSLYAYASQRIRGEMIDAQRGDRYQINAFWNLNAGKPATFVIGNLRDAECRDLIAPEPDDDRPRADVIAERRELLMTWLPRISESQRLAVQLRVLDGLTLRAAAARIGRDKKSISDGIEYATRSLRKIADAEWRPREMAGAA